MPLFWLLQTQACMWCTDIHAAKIPVYMKQVIFGVRLQLYVHLTLFLRLASLSFRMEFLKEGNPGVVAAAFNPCTEAEASLLCM